MKGKRPPFLLYRLLAMLMLVAAPAALATPFEIHLTLTPYAGAPADSIKDVEVSVEDYGPHISQVVPGVTDAEGRTTISFQSDQAAPKVLIVVTENNPAGKVKYVKRFGRYTKETFDGPLTVNGDCRPGLVGYMPEQLPALAKELLDEGHTEIVSRLVYPAVISEPAAAGQALELPDLTKVQDSLVELAGGKAGAAELLKIWSAKVEDPAAGAKPDERFLAALIKRDWQKASSMAIASDQVADKTDPSQLAVARDTGRLIETTIQVNKAVLRDQRLNGMNGALTASLEENISKLQRKLPDGEKLKWNEPGKSWISERPDSEMRPANLDGP